MRTVGTVACVSVVSCPNPRRRRRQRAVHGLTYYTDARTGAVTPGSAVGGESAAVFDDNRSVPA
jgi:hypothetical protein